jgi:hypothetical protein
VDRVLASEAKKESRESLETVKRIRGFGPAAQLDWDNAVFGGHADRLAKEGGLGRGF